MSRRHGNSGYDKSGSSPGGRKGGRKLPPFWLIEQVEAIMNIRSLDASFHKPEGKSLTLGDKLQSNQYTAGSSRTVVLLKTFATTEKQRKIVELLAEGYKPEEIRKELGLKSLSAVTDMIARLRKIKIAGIPLRQVLWNLNKGLSIFGTSFGEGEQ